MPLDDATCLARFQTRELGPEYFDHRGHLRLAWLHIEHFGPQEARSRMLEGIRDLATRFGAPEKFHYTLTEAFMRLVAERMSRDPVARFEAFLAANPDLLTDARAVLAHHYSDECLLSGEARITWVEPDRAAFS